MRCRSVLGRPLGGECRGSRLDDQSGLPGSPAAVRDRALGCPTSQVRTSRSSRLQSRRGRTCVPCRGRTLTSPFAASVLIDFAHHAASDPETDFQVMLRRQRIADRDDVLRDLAAKRRQHRVNAAGLGALVGGFCTRLGQMFPAPVGWLLGRSAGNLSRGRLPAQSSDVKHPMITRMLRCKRFSPVTFHFGTTKKPGTARTTLGANAHHDD